MRPDIEAITKAAIAVKDSSRAKELAGLFEKISKIYEAEAATPKIDNFIAQRKKAKEESRGKFAKAIGSYKQITAHSQLSANGWIRGYHNAETHDSSYGNKSKPGYVLKISGGKFSVLKGTEIKVEPLDLGDIGSYLEMHDKF